MTKSLLKITAGALISMACLTWVQSSAATEPVLPVQVWNPPLNAPIRLVNQYRQPNSDYSAGHRGVDYLVDQNQAVLAPADGEVWFVRKVFQRNLITLRHPGGLLSEFEPVCSDLVKGQAVLQGQEIGHLCEPDSSYTPHCASATCLHFSVRKDGAYLSPLVFIGGLNPSRLLPTP